MPRNRLGFCTSGREASTSVQARGLPPVYKTQVRSERLKAGVPTPPVWSSP